MRIAAAGRARSEQDAALKASELQSAKAQLAQIADELARRGTGVSSEAAASAAVAVSAAEEELAAVEEAISIAETVQTASLKRAADLEAAVTSAEAALAEAAADRAAADAEARRADDEIKSKAAELHAATPDWLARQGRPTGAKRLSNYGWSV